MEKNNNVTELVFILDRSGSMAGLESDTVGGFNSMINKQRREGGECYVSTVLFDNVSEVIHDRASLSKIPPLTEDDYTVRGCTALLDAIGDAVTHVKNIHKYARAEDVPSHTVFVITTDGMENASSRYSKSTVKELIERQRKESGWEFIFIGANIDAIKTAEGYGIDSSRAANFHADKKGVKVVFEAIASAVKSVRGGEGICDDSLEGIRADYKKREEKKNR